MKLFLKSILRILLILLITFLLCFIIVYIVQDRFIFQRQVLNQDHHFAYNAQELTILTSDQIKLNALLFHSKIDSIPKGLILYFHGNRHSLERWGGNAFRLNALGYDVLMIDYRGYGKSSGAPSEQGLYRDAEATLAWALKEYPSSALIYYGRSLGTGVATYLATQHMPKKLILETPYDELKNVVPIYLRFMLDLIPLRHAFKNNERIPMITCPILILHGTQDQIVPLSCALGLKPLLKPIDRFIIIEGGKHYNLNQYQEVRTELKDFLK